MQEHDVALDQANGTGSEPRLPVVVGVHHVRLPVSNVLRSRDWYAQTLGFEPILVTEDEDSVTGVVLEHPSGVFIGLHVAPRQAEALRGFAILGLSVVDLDRVISYLDRLGVAHSGIIDGHLGKCVQVRDPDHLVVELHTPIQPSADEA